MLLPHFYSTFTALLPNPYPPSGPGLTVLLTGLPLRCILGNWTVALERSRVVDQAGGSLSELRLFCGTGDAPTMPVRVSYTDSNLVGRVYVPKPALSPRF